MPFKRRNAFTLVEVLIVVVIMAVLAATIIPQFTDSTDDARTNTAAFNLQTLRSQVQVFRAHHGGTLPAKLEDLTQKTKADGTVDANGPFGPYITSIPEETLTGSKAVENSASDVTNATVSGTTGGWIYDTTDGEVRVNHVDHADL